MSACGEVGLGEVGSGHGVQVRSRGDGASRSSGRRIRAARRSSSSPDFPAARARRRRCSRCSPKKSRSRSTMASPTPTDRAPGSTNSSSMMPRSRPSRRRSMRPTPRPMTTSSMVPTTTHVSGRAEQLAVRGLEGFGACFARGPHCPTAHRSELVRTLARRAPRGVRRRSRCRRVRLPPQSLTSGGQLFDLAEDGAPPPVPGFVAADRGELFAAEAREPLDHLRRRQRVVTRNREPLDRLVVRRPRVTRCFRWSPSPRESPRRR